MTSRERLMATLRGEAVDRPAVNFYEIGGFDVDPSDPDEFNVYHDPSWRPLLELAETRTDLIRMRSAVRSRSWDPQTVNPGGQRTEDRGQSGANLVQIDKYVEDQWHCTRTTVRTGGRTLSSTTRRSPEVDTTWTTEHLLKNVDDLKAYLELPDEFFAEETNVERLIEDDARVGDRGIVMVDTEDPICAAASLFGMEDFLTVALTEPTLFHRLLEKLSRPLYARTECVSEAFPGHLWRIYGPEYAAVLAPSLVQGVRGPLHGADGEGHPEAWRFRPRALSRPDQRNCGPYLSDGCRRDGPHRAASARRCQPRIRAPRVRR